MRKELLSVNISAVGTAFMLALVQMVSLPASVNAEDLSKSEQGAATGLPLQGQVTRRRIIDETHTDAVSGGVATDLQSGKEDLADKKSDVVYGVVYGNIADRRIPQCRDQLIGIVKDPPSSVNSAGFMNAVIFGLGVANTMMNSGGGFGSGMGGGGGGGSCSGH